MNELTNVFKVLSDETRLRIIMMVFQKKLCVCELCEVLKVSQSKISRNLSKLRDMNFVAFERREKFIFYSLKMDNRVLVSVVKDILDDIDEYPDLLEDQKKIIDIERVLKKCNFKHD